MIGTSPTWEGADSRENSVANLDFKATHPCGKKFYWCPVAPT